MAQELEGWVFDIESDNLYLQATKCWYIKFKTFDGLREMSVFPFKEKKEDTKAKIMEWVESFPDGVHVGGFNHLGFDLWLQWRMLNIVPRVGKNGKDWLGDKHVQFIDGYILSQYLSPDQPQHSLAYLSNGSENEDEGKINYRQSLIDIGAILP